MIEADQPAMSSAIQPVEVITRHLSNGTDVVRCAAARALTALGDVDAAPALVDALLDQDPDVRTDAMEALAACARPEDADAIRRSLQGDPVKEVKVFAIEALTRLGDRTAIPLLRALAKDRAADEVAWEDEAGLWDDWLDIQTAAIRALGRLQVSEAIDDLLEARTDEMGQELDLVVFDALAEIEEGGLAALFGLLRDRDAKVRERVIGALSKARPEAMLPMQAILLEDASAAIRRLAIGTLQPESQAAADLVRSDPEPEVRAAALAAFAAARSDLVMTALRDPDERVRAVAVEALPADLDTTVADDLAANLQAWMETAGARLATAAAIALPKVAGGRAEGALCRLAANVERPMEARIAGLRALAGLPSEASLEALERRVEDPVRQIRATALAVLATLAGRKDDPLRKAAEAIMAAAIRGDLGADVVVAKDEPQTAAQDLAAPKAEGGDGRIAISPEGEIVTFDQSDGDDAMPDNVIEGRFPTSTLAAIQTPAFAERAGGDEAATSGAPSSRRRRVAVDGPDDVRRDVRLVALGVIDGSQGPRVDSAHADALRSDDQAVRLAAFTAVAQRGGSAPHAQAIADICRAALEDADSTVRAHAAAFIERNAADAPDLLAAHLDDPDPVLRSTALRASAASSPEEALAGLGDPSPSVRRTAMTLLIASGDQAIIGRAVDRCLVEAHADALAEGCRRSPAVRQALLVAIGDDRSSARRHRIALEALASA